MMLGLKHHDVNGLLRRKPGAFDRHAPCADAPWARDDSGIALRSRHPALVGTSVLGPAKLGVEAGSGLPDGPDERQAAGRRKEDSLIVLALSVSCDRTSRSRSRPAPPRPELPAHQEGQ
jgi:hypothetical protein